MFVFIQMYTDRQDMIITREMGVYQSTIACHVHIVKILKLI